MPRKKKMVLSLSSSDDKESPAAINKRQQQRQPRSTHRRSSSSFSQGDSWSFSSQQSEFQSKGRRKIQIGRALLQDRYDRQDARALQVHVPGQQQQPEQQQQERRQKKRPRTLTARSILPNDDNNAQDEREKPQNQQHARQTSTTSIDRAGKATKRMSSSSSRRRRRHHGSTSCHYEQEESCSSDMNDEKPYTQNLGISESSHHQTLQRQLNALADSSNDDDDDNDKDDTTNDAGKSREPLRPGDVIAYYNPVFVHGHPAGYRVSQVLGTRRVATDGSLRLDNGEFLTTDTMIRRVGEYRQGVVYPHAGVARSIKAFRMHTRRLKGAGSGMERQVERLRESVLRAREEMQKVPENLWKQPPEEDERDTESNPSSSLSVEEVPNPVMTQKGASKKNRSSKLAKKSGAYGAASSDIQARGNLSGKEAPKNNKKALDDDKSTSDDSGLVEMMKSSNRTKGVSTATKQFNHHSTDGGNISLEASNENVPNSQDSNISDAIGVLSKQDVSTTIKAATSKPTTTTMSSPAFSVSRPSQSSQRRPLSSAPSQQRRKPQHSTNHVRDPNSLLFSSDDESDDDLLMAPVFKKSATLSATPTMPVKTIAPKSNSRTISSTGTTPAMTSMTLAGKTTSLSTEGQTKHDSGSLPPRNSSKRQSFGVKDLAQRRMRGFSETPTTLRQAEGMSLDGSDEDDVLSITSANRHLRHRATSTISKKKHGKSSKEKNKKTRAQSIESPKEARPQRASVFRPTQVERSDSHVYGDLPSSSEDDTPVRPRYHNPIARSDDSIGSFRASQGQPKVASWLHQKHHKQHSSSSQAGSMRLSFEAVKHSGY